MTETEKQNKSHQTNGTQETTISDNVAILKSLCTSNADFFSKDRSENGQRLYISFLAIIDAIEALYPKVVDIGKRAEEFDFDENTPGNGYRSYINVFSIAVKYAIDLSQKIMWRRSSLLFRKTVLTK